MSRPIKFRAWSKNDKVMGVPFDLFEELTHENELTGHWLKDTVFLQFTGLIDRKGIEIYEGDILRVCHYEDEDEPTLNEYTNHKVEWSTVAWVLTPNISEDWNDLVMIGEGFEDEPLWMEVIGNIYESPELLNA